MLHYLQLKVKTEKSVGPINNSEALCQVERCLLNYRLQICPKSFNLSSSLKADICNPCGQNCSGYNCDNWKCSFGCADSNFAKRVFDPDSEIVNGSQRIYIRRPELREADKVVIPSDQSFCYNIFLATKTKNCQKRQF